MPVDLIVSDWNGTLLDQPDDEAFNRRLAYAKVGAAVRAALRGRVWRLRDVAAAVRTKRSMERLVAGYRAGRNTLAELYAVYNLGVVSGLPVPFVEAVADAYARDIAPLADRRMLTALRTAHDHGASIVVLSAAYERGIALTLRACGYDDIVDEVVANVLETDGAAARGFTTRYREGKAEAFAGLFIERRGHDPARIVYMGDGTVDEPIAGLLPPGHFVVPLLAADSFRRRMEADHGAFAPDTDRELVAHLRGL